MGPSKFLFKNKKHERKLSKHCSEYYSHLIIPRSNWENKSIWTIDKMIDNFRKLRYWNLPKSDSWFFTNLKINENTRLARLGFSEMGQNFMFRKYSILITLAPFQPPPPCGPIAFRIYRVSSTYFSDKELRP